MSKGCGPGLLFTCIIAAANVGAQTTQAVITGRVLNGRTGEPIADSVVEYANWETGISGSVRSDKDGSYWLPFLSPGTYRIRGEADQFQARELQVLEVQVAAWIELDLRLRPLLYVLEPASANSVFLPDRSAVLPFLGPDLEGGRSSPLDPAAARPGSRQPSPSYVIDPRQIADAPLSARNVYSMIAMLPAVAAAQVSGRGLQLSANGQRASASNYLLDGVENNDYLTTGAFFATAPEAIQEYRVTTSNYTAEFGRTGGFVANAVTRGGGSAWHGQVYGYAGNDVLGANTFQNNRLGTPRQPFKEAYLGYWAGGPILGPRLTVSSAFEQLRSRSRRNLGRLDVLVPSRVRECAGADSPYLRLLDRYPLYNVTDVTPSAPPCQAVGRSFAAPPVFVDRTLAVERVDYRSRDGRGRITGTLTLSRVSQPDHFWSPYQGLFAPLTRNTVGPTVSYVQSLRPGLMNDLRFSWRNGGMTNRKPHPEIPYLQVLSGPETEFALPSSQDPVEFAMRENNWEVADTLVFSRARHVVSVGGGFLLRKPKYLLSYLGEGLYNFNRGADTFRSLALGLATYYLMPVRREDWEQRRQIVPYGLPAYTPYRNTQFHGFVQDNFRVTDRLAISLGARYESFGTFETSSRSGFVQLGAGSSAAERLKNADRVLKFESRPVYRPDRNNWSGRFGVSFRASGSTTLRTGYGVFYDRPYDNLFLDARNSSFLQPFCFDQACNARRIDFEQPITTIAPGSYTAGFINPFPSILVQQVVRDASYNARHWDKLEMLWIDQGLRTPYVQSWFAGIQQSVSPALSFELNHFGSAARKLIASDSVNRLCSFECGSSSSGRLNDGLLDIIYRDNSGASSYAALGALARYRGSRATVQAAYTWSHSIDNQSDPLLQDVFNLAGTNLDAIGQSNNFAAFSRQFDSRADRGNSDFDIRHNLVIASIWQIPGPRRGAWLRRVFGGWQTAQMAGFRSGVPYTVRALSLSGLPSIPSSGGIIIGQRVDVVGRLQLETTRDLPGGVQLIDPDSARIPDGDKVGTLGRNALAGPGFWTVDLSVSKSFAARFLGEAGRFDLRADAVNAFNHSNLERPDTRGVATYGPTQNQATFPPAVSLFSSPRRIRLMVKLYF